MKYAASAAFTYWYLFSCPMDAQMALSTSSKSDSGSVATITRSMPLKYVLSAMRTTAVAGCSSVITTLLVSLQYATYSTVRGDVFPPVRTRRRPVLTTVDRMLCTCHRSAEHLGEGKPSPRPPPYTLLGAQRSW